MTQPSLGPDCDLCVPDCHYLLECPTCGAEFDTHCTIGDHDCPDCGCAVSVSDEEHKRWLALLFGPES
jgi:hypothetical protein